MPPIENNMRLQGMNNRWRQVVTEKRKIKKDYFHKGITRKRNCSVCRQECRLLQYEICGNCMWEYDPFQEKYPDYSGGANVMSLHQAREAYKAGKPAK